MKDKQQPIQTSDINEHKAGPTYEVPQVITYTDEQIRAMMGPAQAGSLSEGDNNVMGG